MFTGLVEEIGSIRSSRPFGSGTRFDVNARLVLQDTAIGDSIAVNGVCLTVVSFDQRVFQAEAVEETLRKSTLGDLRSGSPVNLERALRVGGKLGGHFVQGHVDFTARVLAIERRRESWMVEISFPPESSANIVAMGSIAVDGVSLTVAEKHASSFLVSVIPHTWENTLFSTYEKGKQVNIELDMLGKYVLNALRLEREPDISDARLRELGY